MVRAADSEGLAGLFDMIPAPPRGFRMVLSRHDCLPANGRSVAADRSPVITTARDLPLRSLRPLRSSRPLDGVMLQVAVAALRGCSQGGEPSLRD